MRFCNEFLFSLQYLFYYYYYSIGQIPFLLFQWLICLFFIVIINMLISLNHSLTLIVTLISGLDSASSISLLTTLHILSEIGVTIVATLHQPRKEILDLIDDMILLGM